eukprot:10633101-Ditylum_brightwellii.AAC.1
MEQKGTEGKCLFVLVGRLVYGNEVFFIYPKLYNTEAHTRMAAIGQYLEQQYGAGVCQFFTPKEREQMKLTKWDENGNHIFAEDWMVDQILEECEMEWAVKNFPTKDEETTKPSEVHLAMSTTDTPSALPNPISSNPPIMIQGNPEADSITTWGSKYTANLGNDA